MKIGEYEILEGLYYTREHEWMKLEGEKCRIGVTDYAQKTLHEVVYVDLPARGKIVTQNASLGTVESVKAVSEMYSPISGEVTERNETLVNSPELVNQDPYGAGWIVIVKPSRLKEELVILLEPNDYANFLEQLVKKR